MRNPLAALANVARLACPCSSLRKTNFPLSPRWVSGAWMWNVAMLPHSGFVLYFFVTILLARDTTAPFRSRLGMSTSVQILQAYAWYTFPLAIFTGPVAVCMRLALLIGVPLSGASGAPIEIVSWLFGYLDVGKLIATVHGPEPMPGGHLGWPDDTIFHLEAAIFGGWQPARELREIGWVRVLMPILRAAMSATCHSSFSACIVGRGGAIVAHQKISRRQRLSL